MSYARKKPYISADYEEMRSTRMDSEIYNPNSPQRVESEFKKPYLYDEHPKSEQTYTPPGGFIPVEPPPWTPPGDGQDCIPGGDAIGGGPDLCDPGQDCGQWVFSCAHMIKSFTAVGGSIQSIRYQSNDVVVVTACWGPDRGELVVLATTLNDGEVETSFDKGDCAGIDPECSPCDDCDPVLYPPVISFTTQQMSLDGTQYLYASRGGGGPYTWSITATGTTPGTLSTTETVAGAPMLYTAPSSNEDCLNNPTITVTDFCGHTATLKLAVNGYSGADIAARATGNYGVPGAPLYTDLPNCDGAHNWWCFKSYRCSNFSIACAAYPAGVLCVRTYPPGCGGAEQKCVVNITPTNYCDDPLCTVSAIETRCVAADPFGDTALCSEGIHDARTADMKTNACCPAILL